MRQRATKERRSERHEFVYTYAEEIQYLWYKDLRSHEIIDFVEKTARPLLSYGKTTYYMDIFLTLRRDYVKIFNVNW